jgi:hypothetical protein
MLNSAIVVSLFMAGACIIMSMAVILLWFPGNLGERDEKQSVSVRWLVTGIVVSFASSIIDNTWWGIAWACRYSDSPIWPWWFDNGVYSNIIARQGLKMFAAWCHVKAAVEAGIIREECAQLVLYFALLVGALVALSLVLL